MRLLFSEMHQIRLTSFGSTGACSIYGVYFYYFRFFGGLSHCLLRSNRSPLRRADESGEKGLEAMEEMDAPPRARVAVSIERGPNRDVAHLERQACIQTRNSLHSFHARISSSPVRPMGKGGTFTGHGICAHRRKC